MKIGKFELVYNERFYFGSMLIGGYLAIGAISTQVQITPEQRAVTHDVLLVLGPIVGIIAQNIFKSDKTEKQNSDIVSNLAKKAQEEGASQ